MRTHPAASLNYPTYIVLLEHTQDVPNIFNMEFVHKTHPLDVGTHPCVSLDMKLLIIDNLTIGIYHLVAAFNLVYCVSNPNLNMHVNNVNIEFPNLVNISDISYVLHAHYCNTNS